jgi:predicted ATPase
LITNPVAVTLIDEPEAFLHPPQAQIMGEEIGKLAMEKNSQVILSTHDKDILVGLIKSRAPLDILHLTPTEDTTSSNLFHANDIADLWKDPILRYGNALDGLFASARHHHRS